MIDSIAAKNRFESVMKYSMSTSTRTQLLRIVEFLEDLIESESGELVLQYAPKLVVRVARLVQPLIVSEITDGLLDRLKPLLVNIATQYPDLEVRGICLGMVRNLSEERQHRFSMNN